MDLVIDRMNTEMDWLERGLDLADRPQDDGGWAEYFQENDQADLRIADDYLRAQTALVLENAKQWMVRGSGLFRRRDSNGRIRIDETVRSALVGGYSDYLFPVIRAAFPANPVTELVSVQPTTRRIATIMFWNYVYGTSKGGVVKGQRAYDATVGRQDSGFEYTSERINNEAITGTTGDAGATVTGTLRFHSGGGVAPNTLRLSFTVGAAAREFYDNGNGTFSTPTGVTISASSLNYQTGVFVITLGGGATFDAGTGTAWYRWDSEGSCDLPEMDISITTTTMETERRAIKISYTIEAMQDILAEMGIALEPHLISLAAEELNQEIARQIIHEIWMAAPVQGNFPLSGPANFPQQQYFGDFTYILNRAANTIWERTQKAYANWIVVDSGAASMIESLPAGMFDAAPRPANPQGLHFVGTLNKRFRVYKDLLLRNEPGASAYGNMLIGYKGNDFFDAGFVWSPYQLLYTTDSVPTPCFTVAKGMATRYATKMVNPNMYARINLAA